MIDATKIGRLIAEEITNEPGPCFYPGKFKPPHKGHFKAALDLASRNYVIMVNVIISRKPIEGITPEDSLAIWNMFLQAQPSPKIKVQISTQESPIVDIINYMKKNPSANPVYVAGGDDETDDNDYMGTLEQEFHNRVKAISVHEKDGIISAPYTRELLRTQDYEKFKETVPEAAFNRGAAPKIFKMLASKISHEPQL
jgi:nicotinamide mononucleotide adenylyltransferase